MILYVTHRWSLLCNIMFFNPNSFRYNFAISILSFTTISSNTSFCTTFIIQIFNCSTSVHFLNSFFIFPFAWSLVLLFLYYLIPRVLVATETFAMGVNMPARSVVFNGYRKFDGQSTCRNFTYLYWIERIIYYCYHFHYCCNTTDRFPRSATRRVHSNGR